MQPLERAEQLPRVGGVEAGAVVAHVVADAARLGRPGAELDGRVVVGSGELPGVLQQVLQDGADEREVGLRAGRLRGEGDPAARLAALERGGYPGGFGPQIDELE